MRKLTYLFLLLPLLFSACKDDDFDPDMDPDGPPSVSSDAVLYATYFNPVGGDPELMVDTAESSDVINIEVEPTVLQENGRLLFNYGGVTFKEGQSVYVIDDLTTERKTPSGDWIEDDENFLSWSFSKSLDIVLVIDVSSSLGDNIEAVKINAGQMVSDILDNNPDARISVIKFSRGASFLPFSSNRDSLIQFINQNAIFLSPDIGNYELEGRNETALYESINLAIELLKSSDARGKGILTFTDGVSNFQFDPLYQNPGPIIEKLNANQISSYTVGYEGNQGSVDRTALQSISINGNFSFISDISELSQVFVEFSNSVAAVYDLVYETNTAKLSEPIEYRFLFEMSLISE